MGVSTVDRRWVIILHTPDGVPGILFTGTLRQAKHVFRRLWHDGLSQPPNWPLIDTPYTLTDGCTATLVHLDPTT